MPSSGSGTGSAIVCGLPAAAPRALPIKRTILSLPYYARIMGIDPVNFQGATAGSIFPVIPNRNKDVWPRYSWQASDRVSHEDLARAIYQAERDIAEVLGYWEGPIWISEEIRPFPRHYRRDVWRYSGQDVRMNAVSIKTQWGKVISAGQRATGSGPVCTATVASGSLAYTDEDGDGFAETATISFSTTLTNSCELKVFFTGTEAALEWEIRPPRSKAISGGIATLVFDSWLFIDPDVLAYYPTEAGQHAIDISTTANYVTTVEVYREYTDPTSASAIFYWEPTPTGIGANLFCTSCGGSGCAACTLTTQDGCLHIREPNQGIVVPTPASYDESTGVWSFNCYSVCRDPDFVQIYYYCGEISNESRSGRTCEELPNDLAMAIAELATTRLERPMCAGTNIIALQAHWREDLARSGEVSYALSLGDLNNPFGTQRGAIQAWRRVGKLREHAVQGPVI